ncbi:MAG: ATP-binding protein, partial [Candidatus Latescibacteria bacterium]|nr:ATP-binding protein [Candidatus Latescibacterota bacterium]
RQQALYPVRDAVWDIVSSQDVERLLAAVWGCLVELGIPFERCGVNVVDTRTDPPTVQVRSLGQEGKWIHLGPEFQGNQAILKFWRDQQVVYRRDLAQEDLYGVLDEHRDLGLNPVRSIVDIPFSNGTMAVNSLEPRAFTEQHIADLQAVADVLSEGFRRLDDLQNLEYSNQALRQAHDELEKRVEERTADLEEKNAEMEHFIYTVSHDLKSPLVTIGVFLGALEQDAIEGRTERLQSDLEHMNTAVTLMQQLLDELLELSRIGRIVNPPEEVPLGELMQEVLNWVGGTIAERGIEVIIHPDLPIVFGDRLRLLEVLQNLVSNAAKFMGDQPQPRIEIGLDRNKDAFFVDDNGIGIAHSYHEKVFGLFERLDTGVEGTGIGLALVKRIIETHGGQVWLESEEGKGSRFYFTLPSKPVEVPHA